MNYQRGFTLVELVMMIIILGIIAISVLPRFADTHSFSEAGYAEAARSAVAFARATAVAQRRNVCVAVAPGGLTFTRASAAGGACNTALAVPQAGDTNNTLAPSSGTTLAGYTGTIVFSPSGTAAFPDSPGSTYVNVSAGGNAFIVTSEGYVQGD